MPLTFPSSPTVGQTYTVGTRTWTWTGSIWAMQAVTLGVASISTSELVNNAVTTAKIADDSITTAKIVAGAVVEADIASNAVTVGKLGTDVQLGYRNVVINGAMQVAQRGTSTASITTSGYYTADRWRHTVNSQGTWTSTIEADAPSGTGLTNSLKMLCTTADASPASGDHVRVGQYTEGFPLQQFAFGSAGAKQITVSFWVKSNVTGTYILMLYNADPSPNRHCSQSYTISASGTWEKKVLTFPADTVGVFHNNNGFSLAVDFFMGAGSDRTSGTLQTTWANTVTANEAVGQVNVASTTNNYFQITGVQVEAGSVATPFEFEDYGTTLAKCQRYYYNLLGSGSRWTIGIGFYYSATQVNGEIYFPTTMRTAPTLVATSGTDFYAVDRNGGSDSFNSVTIYDASVNATMIYNNSEASGTAGQAGHIFSGTSGSIAFSAEL